MSDTESVTVDNEYAFALRNALYRGAQDMERQHAIFELRSVKGHDSLAPEFITLYMTVSQDHEDDTGNCFEIPDPSTEDDLASIRLMDQFSNFHDSILQSDDMATAFEAVCSHLFNCQQNSCRDLLIVIPLSALFSVTVVQLQDFGRFEGELFATVRIMIPSRGDTFDPPSSDKKHSSGSGTVVYKGGIYGIEAAKGLPSNWSRTWDGRTSPLSVE